MTDEKVFLEPADGIQSDHPEVAALARKIAGHETDRVEQARLLFEYVRDTIRYSVYTPFEDLEDYLALNTLARGQGYCVQKAAVLCALARSLGIPSRLGFATIKNHLLPDYLDECLPNGVIIYHCFLEWAPAGKWMKSTPSFDKALCEQKGWHVVEFIPDGDAMLAATDLSGRPHVEYLDYHGWRAGVPLAEFKEQNRIHCPGGLEAWSRLLKEGRPEQKA